MPHGVDAAEYAVQPSRCRGAVDRRVAHSQSPQLGSRNRAVLASGQCGQRLAQIGVLFPRYAGIRPTAVRSAPFLWKDAG